MLSACLPLLLLFPFVTTAGTTQHAPSALELEGQWQLEDGAAQRLMRQGKIGKAIEAQRLSLATAIQMAGSDPFALVDSLQGLGSLYDIEGRYHEAETYLTQAVELARKLPAGQGALVRVRALSALGDHYTIGNKNEAAFKLYEEALNVLMEAPPSPKLLPEGAYLMNDLGNIAAEEGQTKKAEVFYLEAIKSWLSMQDSGGQPSDPGGASLSVLALGNLYASEGRLAKAHKALTLALQLARKGFGPNDPALTASMTALGELDMNLGRYVKSRDLFAQALYIERAALGPNDPIVATDWARLANLDRLEGRPGQANRDFGRALSIVGYNLQTQFLYMPEQERLHFLETAAGVFDMFESFAGERADAVPGVTGRLYDLLLWQKGMVATGMTALERQIETSDSARERDLFEQVKAVRLKISNLMYTAPADPAQREKTIASLEIKANALEEQLAKQSAAFRQRQKENRTTWRQVRSALRPGEAAVEYVRYAVYNGKQWTGARRYAALVLRYGSRTPRYIPLGEAATIEGKPMQQYRHWVKRTHKSKPATPPRWGTGFYDAFWKPLLPALGNAKTIYISPAGVLDEIAMGVVRMPKGKLLMDRYRLRIVDSTRDLIPRPQPPAAETAVLVGDPTFHLREPAWKQALQSLKTSGNGIGEKPEAPATEQAETTPRPQFFPAALATEVDLDLHCSIRGDLTCPLPKTKNEVDQIAKLLRARNWKVNTYLGSHALEEAVTKHTRHPRLLVLATHGFFLSSQKKMHEVGLVQGGFGTGLLQQASSGEQDPMLLSGLLFAGVDGVREGSPPPQGAESGIFTAYDASTLDLQGTELVVLSACDTGLGTVAAGEGVLGLRRGFQEAGAHAVLMSMWSVPEQETVELITDFIQNWLATPGKPGDMHKALRLAQFKLRAQTRKPGRGDFPYYWGAWVLVER